MGGARHRQKGNRCERELVQLHKDIGVHCERYPLSGASRFRGSGHDLDVYANGREEAPLVAECKARKNGAGFTTLESWLSDYDLLFLRRNNAEPLVVLPWRVWRSLPVVEFQNGGKPANARRIAHPVTQHTKPVMTSATSERSE